MCCSWTCVCIYKHIVMLLLLMHRGYLEILGLEDSKELQEGLYDQIVLEYLYTCHGLCNTCRGLLDIVEILVAMELQDTL